MVYLKEFLRNGKYFLSIILPMNFLCLIICYESNTRNFLYNISIYDVYGIVIKLCMVMCAAFVIFGLSKAFYDCRKKDAVCYFDTKPIKKSHVFWQRFASHSTYLIAISLISACLVLNPNNAYLAISYRIQFSFNNFALVFMEFFAFLFFIYALTSFLCMLSNGKVFGVIFQTIMLLLTTAFSTFCVYFPVNYITCLISDRLISYNTLTYYGFKYNTIAKAFCSGFNELVKLTDTTMYNIYLYISMLVILIIAAFILLIISSGIVNKSPRRK